MVKKINRKDLIAMLESIECEYIDIEEDKDTNKLKIYPTPIKLLPDKNRDLNDLIA